MDYKVIQLPDTSFATDKVLPPDRKVLEVANLTSRQSLFYSAYCEAGTVAKTSKLLNLAGVQSADSGTVSKTLRIVQAKAMAKGWVAGGDTAVDQKVVKRNVKAVEKKLKNKVSTFVITWAQNATPVHKGFLKSLEQFVDHRKAVLLVIAGRYKNPTSVFTDSQKDEDYWPDEVANYLIDCKIRLNKNCVIMGNIKTQPTAEKPLSGLKSITKEKTGVFGHPKVALETVATPQNKLAKILTTTGAVTQRNYTDSKAGGKGEFHHTFGAAVIEVQGDKFFKREINACEDGSFIDLEHEYFPTKVRKAKRAKGLVLGDLHTEFIDPQCEQAIFGKGGMIEVLNPEKVIMHDWYDGYSGSPHHKDRLFINYAKHHSGMGNVRGEIERTLDKTSDWVEPGRDYYVVDSNHNQHLVQWLQNVDPKKDFENTRFWCEIMAKMLPETMFRKTKVEYPNPLQMLAKERLGLKNLHFTTSSDKLMICDIDCSQHGHKGPNGSRGTVSALSQLGSKNITGHGHSPAIMFGHYRVGHNCYPDLEYVDGPSSWMQSDCLIYANGKRTLIHKFDGKWRAKRGRA